MASLTGKEIGKYRIGERIGQGGMAEVYMGIHIHLDRQVAIKVLHGHLLESGDFLTRFKREAKAVANLRHPNIVQVHDFDVQDEIIFMVMEYIEGTNLQKRLDALRRQGERLSIAKMGSIIKDVAAAVDYAHSKGMLHRDIKPSNILLDKDDKAYLADFGIARILSDQKFTATGTLMGTPAYMSPEQGTGDELSRESDTYSLGIVAFEMITGQVPYDAPTPIGIVHKQISDPIPDISKFVDDVPDLTQEVIDTALAKSPESRYPSADALVTALRGALQALESVEPSATKAAPMATEGEVLQTPTIAVQEPDLEQPTVLMEESKQPESMEEPDIGKDIVPEEKEERGVKKDVGEKKPSFFSFTRNRILSAVAGIVLIGAIVVGVQSLGSTPATPDQTLPTEPSEQTGPRPELSGEEYYEEAQMFMEQVRWANAIESLDLAIAAGFEHPDVYGLRAYAKLNRGNKIAAIDDFTRAIELSDEGIFEYWRDRGFTKFELGNLDEAIADLNHGLELNTLDPIGYRYRARVYSELGGIAEAIEDALQAARIEPENFENYFILIEVYRFTESPPHQAEEAMAVLERAVELDPANPEIHILRGQIFWYEWGDEMNALNEFNLAVEHAYPDWANPFDTRGLFYQEIGRCDLAVEDYSHFLTINPDHPWILHRRAECFAQLGDFDQARADFVSFMIHSTGIPELTDMRLGVREWLESHPE